MVKYTAFSLLGSHHRPCQRAQLLGEYLETLHDERSVIVLHDRRIPGTRSNIDYIAITRSGGVWAIDAKNYTGKVQRVDKGGRLSTDFHLYVGRRDCMSAAATAPSSCTAWRSRSMRSGRRSTSR